MNASHAAALNHQIVEQRYRELLLETCDIINLANLPEQDRHITQKQQELKLRGLYIPLRVQIEASVNEERIRLGQEQKVWEALEKRRAMAMRGKFSKDKLDGEHQRVPVGERLTKAKRLVVLGDPGAGKTTLTRWIATAYLLRLKQSQEWAELPDVKTLPDEDWLPIIVRCRDLDVDCLTGSLDDILKHTLRKAELTEGEVAELRVLLQTRIETGQALLMLDGLDEITDPTARTSFCQQLEQIVIAYPNMPIIATSRIVGYREMGYKIGRGFEHLTLADLTPEEKDDFAGRWCALTEIPERRKEAARELIHDIHSADRIERLTGNPMLLTTMALVKRKIGKLPNRRAELYWEAVQVLLNWRSDVGAQLDVREALPQLEYLAYYMCNLGVQHLQKDEILDLLTRMRKEYPYVYPAHNRTPDEFLKCLESRTGILVEAGHERHLGMLVPVYEFRHLTFQEYLAARALVDGHYPDRDPKQSLAAHVAPLAGRTTDMAFIEGGPQETAVVENWREALRLCAAICKDDDIDSFLHAILTPQEGESKAIHRARAILATLCVADEPNVSEFAVQEIFQAFIQQIRMDDGGGTVKTGVDVATRAVAGTRWSALLLAILLGDFFHSDVTRRDVVGDLCGLIVATEAPQNMTDLIAWLKRQVNDLNQAQETQVTEKALGIMQLGFEDRLLNIPGLAEGLLSHMISHLKSNPPVSHAAAAALDWISLRNSWRPKEAVFEQLLAILQDQDTDLGVAEALALLFGNIYDQRAVVPLIIRLEDDTVNVRQAAAIALGKIGSEKAVMPLIACLDDDAEDVRRSAATALGNIQSEAAVTPLIACLEDDDVTVRQSAATALSDIKSEVAVAPLIARLDDNAIDVRQWAAIVLGGIKSEMAVTPLIARLDDDAVDVRWAAAMSLGNIQSEAAITSLIARLDDDDVDIRRTAAMALGSTKSEAAVMPLIARLEDDDVDVRWAAAMSLGDIKSEAAVMPLIARLEDDAVTVRQWTAMSLGDIKSEMAVTPLIARLDDDDATVRQWAAMSLGKIGSEAAITLLIARLDDDDVDVRRAALGGLAQTIEDIDRKLLSEDLDGFPLFLDPSAPIRYSFVKEAASNLALSLDEVQARYKAINERYRINLRWHSSD